MMADAEMFTPEPEVLQFSGVLRIDAQVRMKPVGADGRPHPVLCLDVARVGGTHRSLHAEKIFPEAGHALAEAEAKTLRKGTPIHLTHNMQEVRIFLPHVESIHVAP